ncbi:MAG TPA: hypothetical protein VNA19_00415 [Pyrinomonadaceae bacterium]|jgi:hypothetical protein|nr:hypothetical protein [Pyrinomonadaceae bacterium]
MSRKTFRIKGRVIERASREAAAGLRVEAWDKDKKYDDLLGSAVTDAGGCFQISFDKSHFADDRGNKLPDLFFRIYHEENLIKDTEDSVRWNVAAGDIPIDFEVELGHEQRAMGILPATGTPTTPASLEPSTEVAIHELGESIAATIATVQQELARYPNPLGAYVLDEVDLSIPILMRVDSFGQVLARVTEKQTTDSIVGQMRLKMKPVLGARVPPPVVSGQTLESLGVLSPEAILMLQAQRIFSVDDLLRVTRTTSGRVALSKVDLGAPVDTVMNRIDVMRLPMLTPEIGASLLRIGVEKPTDILEMDAERLAENLQNEIKVPIPTEEVARWQQELQEFVRPTLPAPTRPETDGGTTPPTPTGSVLSAPKIDIPDLTPRIETFEITPRPEATETTRPKIGDAPVFSCEEATATRPTFRARKTGNSNRTNGKKTAPKRTAVKGKKKR